MDQPLDILEAALLAIDTARKRAAGYKHKQIRNTDLTDYYKSVSFAWFRTHRPALLDAVVADNLGDIDEPLQRLLDATQRSSSRVTYVNALTDAKAGLMGLRSQLLTATSVSTSADNLAPDFSPLATDAAMQRILNRRWSECQLCIGGGAHLAATVMMGGLLEALFVARANRLLDKSILFRAKATPIDKKTQKSLPLSGWTLRAYIDVAHELGWITKSGRDVATVLRDYRNYVHPEKERSHNISLSDQDSSMFWQLTKSLTSQLLKSAKSP